MSAYLNQIILIGRIGKKPEFSVTNDGKKIAKFSLATSEHWIDRETKARKEKTEWHKVVVFSSKIAEVIEQYVGEGALVCVEGKIRYEKWTNAQGAEQKSTVIAIDLNGKFMMLERKKTDGGGGSSSMEFEGKHAENSHEPIDDEIPF